MKRILSLLLFLLPAGNMLTAQQLRVGSISINQSFSVSNGDRLTNASYADYEGSILLVMLYTPWCPICQSNARGAGLGLAAHFAAAGRGVLSGKNANGVPIRTLLLSTEEASQWDSTNASFAATNQYSDWGLDATASRSSARTLLGYYRGGRINSSNLNDWGNDRRRLVVLNLVRSSPSHQFREIVINQNSYSSSNNSAARSAIDAIQPASVIDPPLPPPDEPDVPLADTIAPTLTITSGIPTRPVTRKFTLRGTAADTGGISEVYAVVGSRKTRYKATGTDRWSIALTLPRGSHTIRIQAVDLAGNTSTSAPFTVRSTAKRARKISSFIGG